MCRRGRYVRSGIGEVAEAGAPASFDVEREAVERAGAKPGDEDTKPRVCAMAANAVTSTSNAARDTRLMA